MFLDDILIDQVVVTSQTKIDGRLAYIFDGVTDHLTILAYEKSRVLRSPGAVVEKVRLKSRRVAQRFLPGSFGTD